MSAGARLLQAIICMNDEPVQSQVEPGVDLSSQAIGAFEEGTISVLLRHLETRRGLVAIGYLIVMVLFTTLVLMWTPLGIPELLPRVVTMAMLGSDTVEPHFLTVSQIGEGLQSAVFGVVLAFYGLQALFIWGGGRVRVSGKRSRWPRKLMAIPIFASMMAGLVIGLLLCFMEFGDWTANNDRSTRSGVITDMAHALGAEAMDSRTFFNYIVYPLVAVSWLFWLAVAILCFRGVNQYTGLSRLTGVLLIGSWIEFAVALPIEVVVRPRHESCPCDSMSWLTLLFCAPLLLWSFGPALYLFYLRQKHLATINPDYARKVLRRKTARSGHRRVKP